MTRSATSDTNASAKTKRRGQIGRGRCTGGAPAVSPIGGASGPGELDHQPDQHASPRYDERLADLSGEARIIPGTWRARRGGAPSANRKRAQVSASVPRSAVSGNNRDASTSALKPPAMASRAIAACLRQHCPPATGRRTGTQRRRPARWQTATSGAARGDAIGARPLSGCADPVTRFFIGVVARTVKNCG